jgi:hypothetical protein
VKIATISSYYITHNYLCREKDEDELVDLAEKEGLDVEEDDEKEDLGDVDRWKDVDGWLAGDVVRDVLL